MTLPILEPDVIIGNDPRLILVCDHATNHVPDEIDLGVSHADMQQHIAWDIGAGALTRMIAGLMGASAVLAPVSRLVIDCNRGLDHPAVIPPVSDGVSVPGNHNLSDADVAARVTAYHDPFHAAIDRVVRRSLSKTESAIIVAVHSFTDQMNGRKRHWDAGFLWNTDPRLAQAMIGLLERETDMIIGDNQPYSGKKLYHTMQRHGADWGIAQSTMEIRDDHLRDGPNIGAWARLLADLFDECLERDDIMTRLPHPLVEEAS